MSTTLIDPGRYRVEVLDQNFTENEEGKPGFVIFFKVLASVEKPDAPVASTAPRSMTLWIDDESKGRVWRYLDELGFAGKSLYYLRPEVKGFYDLRGKQFELICTHREGRGKFAGKTFENWDFPATKPKLRNPRVLLRFDRDGSASGNDEEAVLTGDITDHDVPF
jgi:hypothetical protein